MKEIEKCEKCGFTTKILRDGTEYHKICDCNRRISALKRIEKYKNLSVTDRQNNENIFANSKPLTETEREKYKVLYSYSNNFKKEKKGFILIGPPGTGKTFAASCIANHIKEEFFNTLSFTVEGYLIKLREDISEENKSQNEVKLLNIVLNCDLLIIDDLGSEILTDWGKSKLFQIIDGRYRVGKPLIITTNLNHQKLKEHLFFQGTDKILDRLHEMCKPIMFDWESKRKWSDE